jgi:CHAT domain-containing protein
VLPGADGRLLIEQYRISYVGCGRDVLRFGAAPSGQPTEPLVVADPDFDLGDQSPAFPPATPARSGRQSRDFQRSDYHFDRLPGTRGEGETIAALLGVSPWLDVAALEAHLKQRRSPRLLHLATHGFFLQDEKRDPNWEVGIPGRLSGPLPENPLLRSGLALAGANTWLQEGSLPAEAEDGLLTAEDVAGLDLLDTELVVLSACETGLGQGHIGEGVFGLRRSFIVAGAKTLVMSLWKVPDEQTRELMEDFYRRILAGQGRADALREAQLALKEKYPDPYYWGAFICQGDPGPLTARSSPSA